MRSHFLLLTPAIFLSACLTTQENPNYEYSSRYQPPARIQMGQTAPETTTSTTAAAAPITYETQGVTYQTQPVPYQTEAVTYDPQPVASAPSVTTTAIAAPTDAQYATQEVTGTPGYMALAQESATQPSSQASSVSLITASQPQRVAYDYSQNLIAADAIIDAPEYADEVRTLVPSVQNYAGQDYTVRQGDTIYALSRKHCVGVDVIRSMNTIGADYAIKIGQTIRLPDSRC